MKTHKIPQRKCVMCGEHKEKKQLIRIVKTPDDVIMIDETGKMNGRGAYLCKSNECLENAKKKRRLEGSLKSQIPVEIYTELERILSE